jgi:hypothetical protein
MPGKPISEVHSEMQRAEAPSVIPDNMPSPFGEDEGNEEGIAPAEQSINAQQEEVSVPTGEGSGSDETADDGRPSYEQLEEMVTSSREDLQLMEAIKSDPQAVELLNQHFRQKSLPAGDTSDVNNIRNDNEGSQPQGQVGDLIQRMMQQQQQLAAQVAVMQFEKTHPDFNDPNIKNTMRKIYNTQGYENMRLEDAYALAKAKLGSSASPRGKAPALRSSETGGASAPDLVGRNDSPSLQKSIDEQRVSRCCG